MDIGILTDNELADLVLNLVELLAGPEPLAIEPHMRAQLVADFGSDPVDFAAQISEAAAAEDARKAACSIKNQLRARISDTLRRSHHTLKGAGATKDEFALARLHFRKERAGEYFAQDPEGISAVGFSNGINIGRFKGNNRRQSIVYEVWRREGRDGVWKQHILTKKQKFKDENVTPGRYYEYRVRAIAAKNSSDFSNVTVVYGVL